MENLIQINNASKEQGKEPMYIRTYGCQMNEYDSQKIAKILEKDYYPVESPEEANLVIVNTCSVREKPEQKLYSYLGEMAILKKSNPKLLVGVCGCVAQQEGENITKRSRAVDFVFGTHNISLVSSLIQRRKIDGTRQVAIDYRDEWEELPLGVPVDGRVTRFVAISRGCDKACTYCIVPTTRGPEASRSFDEILRECRIAAHGGVVEVVLLGQTVNSYGKDLSPKRKFIDLLDEVSRIEGIQRIRFTSPHPQEIRDDFIDLVCSNDKICKHIHMPLQSGSDVILKAMNRNYRSARYLDIINSIKTRVPDMAITTDIIVGFPGETEKDFMDTMDVLNKVRFDSSYSFVFSPRPGTKAAEMKEELSGQQKLERLQILQKRQEEITSEVLDSWIGKEGEVLIDGPSAHDPTRVQGRLSQNIIVNFSESIPHAEPGQILKVKIAGRGRYTLKA